MSSKIVTEDFQIASYLLGIGSGLSIASILIKSWLPWLIIWGSGAIFIMLGIYIPRRVKNAN